jgi:hypothetical protein
MDRCRLVLAAPAVSALVLLPACGAAEETPPSAAASVSVPGGASPTSGAPATTADGGAAGAGSDAAAEIVFADQAGTGDVAVVARVALPVAGFVVVTEDEGADDRVLGATVLPAGVVTDVQVPLVPPLAEDTDLEATLHADTDGDGVFDPARDERVPEPGDEEDDVSENAAYDLR